MVESRWKNGPCAVSTGLDRNKSLPIPPLKVVFGTVPPEFTAKQVTEMRRCLVPCQTSLGDQMVQIGMDLFQHSINCAQQSIQKRPRSIRMAGPKPQLAEPTMLCYCKSPFPGIPTDSRRFSPMSTFGGGTRLPSVSARHSHKRKAEVRNPLGRMAGDNLIETSVISALM